MGTNARIADEWTKKEEYGNWNYFCDTTSYGWLCAEVSSIRYNTGQAKVCITHPSLLLDNLKDLVYETIKINVNT
jgi:hypothetical protein